MRKIYKVGIVALGLSAALSFTAFAGQWQQNTTGWWYQNDDNSYPTSQWQWLDGNKDGVSECYYFNPDGYMLSNTTTPDGYTVNADGAWVVDSVVQTQGSPQQPASDNTSIKLQTDFIKQKYVDCLGKDKDYVLNKLGSGFKEVENPFYDSIDGMDGDTYIEVAIDPSIGTVFKITSRFGWGMFNNDKDSYSINEFSDLLKAEAYLNKSKQVCWPLSENPTVILNDERLPNDKTLSFGLHYFNN